MYDGLNQEIMVHITMEELNVHPSIQENNKPSHTPGWIVGKLPQESQRKTHLPTRR